MFIHFKFLNNHRSLADRLANPFPVSKGSFDARPIICPVSHFIKELAEMLPSKTSPRWTICITVYSSAPTKGVTKVPCVTKYRSQMVRAKILLHHDINIISVGHFVKLSMPLYRTKAMAETAESKKEEADYKRLHNFPLIRVRSASCAVSLSVLCLISRTACCSF